MHEYKKLNNQPLQFVLAEIRFSPVMEIGKYIPKIQDALRKHYPVTATKKEQTVQVQPGSIHVSNVDRWAMISADKKSAVEIDQGRLVYVTKDYARFPGFSERCQQALDTFAGIVDPDLLYRVGLRYSDLVVVGRDESLSSLVNEHFGYPQCVSSLGESKQQSSETYIQTKTGGLVIRTLYGNHNLTCLPDAQGLPIQLPSDQKPSERMILDFDHFWQANDEPVSFRTDDVIGELDGLHETSREAFWTITTDYARNEKWSS